MTEPSPARRPLSWPQVIGYFAMFFLAMGLGGVLFLAGGIGLVLIPGSLPTAVKVGYIAAGVIGSVVIAVLVANGAFRATARTSERPGARTSGSAGAPTSARRAPRAVAWVAGIVGTVLASALSAVAGVLVERWIG
jgi:hypothetical protein